MRNPQRGAANWAALAAIVAALAAVVSAAMIVRELHEQEQRLALRSTLDTLGRFDTEWGSDDMTGVRGAASSSLLQERPSRDVGDILDFFDEIAFLVDRGALDPEIVWYRFYWPMANYWLASQDYVEYVRRDDPDAWEHLARAVTRLAAIEQERRKHAPPQGQPTDEQVRDFLNDEMEAGQCTDEPDDDVRRTPL